MPLLQPHRALRHLTRRRHSTFAHLQPEMQARKIPLVLDDLTPLQSYRLDVSLAGFLPGTRQVPRTRHTCRPGGNDLGPCSIPHLLPGPSDSNILPIPHHLLYFEPSLPPRHLLPDGTNPLHSPGAPFHRRMWAGGSVRYSHATPLLLDSRRAACVEGIRSAVLKGLPGAEKVFVGIERRLAYLTPSEAAATTDAAACASAAAQLEADIRGRVWRDDDDDLGPASVLERRNIVFLRDHVASGPSAAGPATNKILAPTREPSLFRHVFTPDAQLLFRFSALTFNAHAIHLDPRFCAEREGHRDLLFHGPLSYALMVAMLQRSLPRAERVAFVEYRNLGPLYCHEPVALCGWRDPARAGRYEVWVEGPDGGVKVKGTARTTTAG